jgi:hypothetical protein
MRLRQHPNVAPGLKATTPICSQPQNLSLHGRHATFFPIESAMTEISHRYKLLGDAPPFATLIKHVRTKSPAPGDHLAYAPDFALTDLYSARAKPHRHKAAELLEQLAALETAVACCLAAKAPVAKPMRLLLFDALAFCQKFDQLRASADEADRKRHDARVKGGKSRQAMLEPAREYARRLDATLQPPGGWKNHLERAKTIASEVKTFIIENRLSLVPEENLYRTVGRWLDKDPPGNRPAT